MRRSALEVCVSLLVSVESHHQVPGESETSRFLGIFRVSAFSVTLLHNERRHRDLCLAIDVVVLG